MKTKSTLTHSSTKWVDLDISTYVHCVEKINIFLSLAIGHLDTVHTNQWLNSCQLFNSKIVRMQFYSNLCFDIDQKGTILRLDQNQL